jgi:hypothetical protein
MKIERNTIILAVGLFIIGIVCGSKGMNAAVAQAADLSGQNLWFLISVREQLAKKNIVNAEELIDVNIDKELSNIRRDVNAVGTISTNTLWVAYLSKINLIWKTSPPYSSKQFTSQMDQDWYKEFAEQHNQNQKLLDRVTQTK